MTRRRLLALGGLALLAACAPEANGDPSCWLVEVDRGDQFSHQIRCAPGPTVERGEVMERF